MTHWKKLHWGVLSLLLLALVACERPAQNTETLEIPTAPVIQATAVDFGQPTVDPAATPAAVDPNATPAPGEPQPIDPIATPEETAPVATETSTGEQRYVVEAGDSLSRIALIYGVSIEDIVAANNMDSPDTLEVGQELIIPEAGFAETAAPAPTAETPAEGETSTAEQLYIVQSGDSLYSIGLAYGFTIEELQAYNNLADPADLDIGQEIKIPPQE